MPSMLKPIHVEVLQWTTCWKSLIVYCRPSNRRVRRCHRMLLRSQPPISGSKPRENASSTSGRSVTVPACLNVSRRREFSTKRSWRMSSRATRNRFPTFSAQSDNAISARRSSRMLSGVQSAKPVRGAPGRRKSSALSSPGSYHVNMPSSWRAVLIVSPASSWSRRAGRI